MQYQRRPPRYRVHLSVRYSTAREFVQEYAENLSSGGLFITGAYALEPLQQVTVRIELPGYGEFEVKAEVVHIIPPDKATEYKRPAGAGLAIVEAPMGFDQILKSYLWRLGSRKDHTIMISDEPVGILLSATGYRVKRVPAPDEVIPQITESEKPVIGILVPSTDISTYARALNGSGVDRLLHAIDGFANIDQMLARLDEELLRRLRQQQMSESGELDDF